MVYNPPYPSNINDFDIQSGFTALANSPDPTPRVKVFYGGSGIHDIAGPVPFVKISEVPMATENGEIFSSKVSIRLEGKISRTGTVPLGIGNAISGIEALRGLFYGSGADGSLDRDKYNGTFSITCDGDTSLIYSGVRIMGFEASPTPDNWTNSVNYGVDLETYVPRNSGMYKIKSASEDWTIEPLEEYAYYNKGFAAGSGQDPADLRAGRIANSIDLVSLPQYRVSRKLTAVGFVGYDNIGMRSFHTAFDNAKRWVVDRIKLAHSGTTSTNPYMQFQNLESSYFLYNHIRSTNFSIEAGSYEVNDTWLAMPTGIGYTEDYTISTSTDMKNIKTVQVQGEIKGLVIANRDIERGNSSRMFPPTGTDLILHSGMGGAPEMDNGRPYEYGGAAIVHQKLDAISINSPDKIYNHKYINALSGWLNDIKPYLYKRATIGSHGPDRNVNSYPYNTFDSAAGIVRPNPMYCKDNLLNIIPISTSENHDPKKGSISYTYEYSNRYKHLSGVISEHISINDNNPTDVINEAFVLGRRLGPALQNLGSRTSTKRDLAIEITVVPPSSIAGFLYTNKECPLYTGGMVMSGLVTLINYFKPYSASRATDLGIYSFPSGISYISNNQTNWDPIQGRFTYNVSWLYQPCQLRYNTLDS